MHQIAYEQAGDYTDMEAVTDAAGVSDQHPQRREVGDMIPAEGLASASHCLQPVNTYSADNKDGGLVSTEPTPHCVDSDVDTGKIKSFVEQYAEMASFVNWENGEEVLQVAADVLEYAAVSQPQPDGEEAPQVSVLASGGGSCLQVLLQQAGLPPVTQGSPGSSTSSSDLELLGSQLDALLTKRSSRAALDLAVKRVRMCCLTTAVRQQHPAEVWVIDNYEAIMEAFRPEQGAR